MRTVGTAYEQAWPSQADEPCPAHNSTNSCEGAYAVLPFIEPTQEQGAAFIGRAISGPIVMLNLLRFRELADYSGSPEIAPDQPISGAEAYRRYEDHTARSSTPQVVRCCSAGKGATVDRAGRGMVGPHPARPPPRRADLPFHGQRGLSRLYRPSHSRPRGLQTRAGDLNTTRSRRWRHRLTQVAFALDAGPPARDT